MSRTSGENGGLDQNPESKVSGYLREGLAPVIQECLMGPGLYRSFPAALPLITLVNKSHILMLAHCGVITQKTAQGLARAVLELEAGGVDAFELDPTLEEAYFNYEAKLIELTGIEVGGQLHVARSRNDLMSSMDRLRSRDLCLRILQGIYSLRETMIERGEFYKDVVMPGYTHFQPAQPITFGYYLLGAAFALERDWQRISECYVRINQNPLGAGACAGVTFPIDRQMTARLMGFDKVTGHSLDAVASRDYLSELISGCALTASTIGRMAQEFYIMTTFEFQTLRLPDSVAVTSSIMPQKKNMCSLEILKNRVAQTTGALVTALTATKAAQFSFSMDSMHEGLRWAWDALEDIALSLPAARFVIENAEPQRQRMLELVQANFSNITDLADALVKLYDLSFREAHHVAGRVARLATDQGLSSNQITTQIVKQASENILGRPIELEQSMIDEILDPALAVQRRAGTASPAASDIEIMLSDLKSNLAEDRVLLERRQDKVSRALQQLETDFASLGNG